MNYKDEFHSELVELISKKMGDARQILSDADLIDVIEGAKQALHDESPLKGQPVDRTRWVDVEDVQANDYNPNSVAGQEMALLYTSILHDGYTQPVVTIWDEDVKKFIIVDGFHRYFICKNNTDILERNNGKLPIVVLAKDINERMASTVRHNRARGKHSVEGMSNMVFNMLENGWSDSEICNHLGMEPDELLRLKHITGFSKLFADAEYSKTWITKHQIKLKKEQKDAEKAEINEGG